jgi:hypothetical protein
MAATQAERVFESMLDDLCMDVALQAHRELVLAQRPCPICHTRLARFHPRSCNLCLSKAQMWTISSVLIKTRGHHLSDKVGVVNHAPADDNETPFDTSAAEGDGRAGNNIILKCSNCDQKVDTHSVPPLSSSSDP